MAVDAQRIVDHADAARGRVVLHVGVEDVGVHAEPGREERLVAVSLGGEATGWARERN